MFLAEVFDQILAFSATIQGVSVPEGQYPIDLPWTGNKYDGSFFSYKIILDTQNNNKMAVINNVRNFAQRFASQGGSHPPLSILREEKLENQKLEQQKEEDDEKGEFKDIPTEVKEMLEELQEQISKLNISQQQIKEQQQQIQDTLTRLEVSCVKNENKQVVQKVQILNCKIDNAEQSLNQLEAQTNRIKQILLFQDLAQVGYQQCNNTIYQGKQQQSNEEVEKQNISEVQIDRKSTKCSDNQSFDESSIQSQLDQYSLNKLDEKYQFNIDEIKHRKIFENKKNQLSINSNLIFDDINHLPAKHPQQKYLKEEKVQKECLQIQKLEQTNLYNSFLSTDSFTEQIDNCLRINLSKSIQQK
ncbi:hypothetical protein ABPG72_015851 [Tetrahymena utriculariae]